MKLAWRPTALRMNRHQLFLLVGTLLLAAVVYLGFNLMPLGGGARTGVVISGGQSAPAIGKQLQEAGIIRSGWAFNLYVTASAQRRKLQAGTYEFSSSWSVPTIAAKLVKGEVTKNLLVIPEGSDTFKITQLLKAKGFSAAEIKAGLAAAYGTKALEGRPTGAGLEGYLFPDSYHLPATTTVEAVLRQLLANFERRVGDKYVQGFAARGLSLHQGLTLASIIEKEVAKESDRRQVAQVFYKRLAEKKPLESDVTVEYGAKLLGASFSTQLDSPYNTYRAAALPPGPICNPGLAALEAAINPTEGDYLYFVSGKDGKTYFSRTFEEHQANVRKYHR